jgi:hypothetical protein
VDLRAPLRDHQHLPNSHHRRPRADEPSPQPLTSWPLLTFPPSTSLSNRRAKACGPLPSARSGFVSQAPVPRRPVQMPARHSPAFSSVLVCLGGVSVLATHFVRICRKGDGTGHPSPFGRGSPPTSLRPNDMCSLPHSISTWPPRAACVTRCAQPLSIPDNSCKLSMQRRPPQHTSQQPGVTKTSPTISSHGKYRGCPP